MGDRPIIFSAPMIRALLDGRKTQTRRVVKNVTDMPPPRCHPAHTPKRAAPYLDAYCGEPKTSLNPRGMGHDWYWWQVDDRLGPFACRLPYAPGDRLWCREAWRTDAEWDDCPARDFDGADAIHYEADGEQRLHLWGDPFHPGRVRSPIHMPRWASRLTLLVTEVRVQRLQEISRGDAKAEGLATLTKDGNLWKFGIPDRDGLPGNDDHGWHWEDWQVDARKAFSRLWNSIHGPDAWEAYPWVAAISFETRRYNIDKMEEGNW